MIHQELLRRAVGERNPALRDFVETLAPKLMVRFSSVSALGGSAKATNQSVGPPLPPEATPLTARDRETFSRAGDQSLSAHLFNGIFAGARMAEHLPDDRKLRDEEWRVWLLGFVVHDYTKMGGMNIRAESIPAIRTYILQWGEELDFAAFFPLWREYLDDIVFIAQNTQKVRGANLDMHLFPNTRLRQRRLDTLRMLASYADVLVHMRRAAEVAEPDDSGRDRSGNLQKTLNWLFLDNAPRLAYHQLTEVRGLLSNLINNALMRALQAQGYEPYLFFPDGVVYIVPAGHHATLDSEAMIRQLWGEVGLVLAGSTSDGDEAGESEEGEAVEGGMRISRTKDYMKVPPVLYELLDPAALVAAGKAAAMRTRTALASERLGAEIAEQQGISYARLSLKDKKALFAQLGAEYMQREGLPTDVRVDQLAEFLGFLWRRILRQSFPKADWATKLLLQELGLSETITTERAEAQRSGTPTGWFFVAAHYIKQHSLDPNQLEERMGEIGQNVLRFATTQPGGQQATSRFEAAFVDYVRSIVTIDGSMLLSSAHAIERFATELRQYTERKAGNKVQCSLCSSPYEARPQDKSEVLFKPQQYSNKTRLDTSTVVRGICPICALEMMLRQVQQHMRAGSAQDKKPITLYLYPTYFFTSETAQVVHEFINRMRDLSLPDLVFKHLGRAGFSLDALAQYSEFVASDPDDTTKHSYSLNKPIYSDKDPASLFFFTMRPKEPLDSEAWIIPTLYALMLPLLLDVKVVVSSSFVPLYNSGADFLGMSMLDAPHGFTRYVLEREHMRVDELPRVLWRLLRLYELHLDVFMEPTDLHWGLVNAIAKDVATDPLYIFSYYERKQRKPKAEGTKAAGKAKAKKAVAETSGDGIPPFTITRYLDIYKTLRKDDPMSFIKKLVDGYAAFYRAENLKAAYAVLRPLATALDVVVDSDPKTKPDDLLLLVAGALNDDQERVRSGQADGFDPIARDKSLGTYPERLAMSRQKIEVFAQVFLDEAFNGYCNGDRGILRERANRLRSAARFYYLSRYARRDQITEETDETAVTASA